MTKKARTAAKDDDDDEDDLTADMDDPAPENPVSEVKLTAANAGRADMQPSKPGEQDFCFEYSFKTQQILIFQQRIPHRDTAYRICYAH